MSFYLSRLLFSRRFGRSRSGQKRRTCQNLSKSNHLFIHNKVVPICSHPSVFLSFLLDPSINHLFFALSQQFIFLYLFTGRLWAPSPRLRYMLLQGGFSVLSGIELRSLLLREDIFFFNIYLRCKNFHCPMGIRPLLRLR